MSSISAWSKYKSQPRSVRIIFSIYSICFLVGTFNHVHDLFTLGFSPYPQFSQFLNAYWTSLTLFDPLAILLLFAAPRIGLVLSIFIMTTDVSINSYACYIPLKGEYLVSSGVILQSIFLGFILGSVPYTWGRLQQAGPAP